MPDSWEIAIFIHVVGVFGFGGAAITELFAMTMARRATKVQDVRLWSGLGVIVGPIFPALSLLQLLTGAYLVDKLHYEFSDGWVGWSALALIVATIIGFVINKQRIDAMHAAAEAAPDGPLTPELAAQVMDPILFGSMHALTLTVLGIMWNMTTKPGGFEAFWVIALFAVIGAGSAYPMIKRQQEILGG